MDFVIAACGVGFVIYLIYRVVIYFRNEREVKKSENWLTTQATIQGCDMQTVYHDRYTSITLPCFNFSYVVNGEYCSGEFSLDVRDSGAATSLVRELVDKSFEVRYDPAKPDCWYIADEIAGYEVHQALEPAMISLSPKD